jgi:drug/metabolite transporter (DMT)-like permease
MLAAVICLGVVWGSAFLLIKVLVDELSPTNVVAGRVVLGLAASAVLLAVLRKLRRPTVALLVQGMVLSVVDQIIPAMLVSWGSTRIASGQASVLMSTMPIFTAIFAVLLAREKVSPARAFGVALGFIGVFMLTEARLLEPGRGAGLGMMAVLAAAAAHAAGVMYAKRLLQKTDPLTLNFVKLGTGSVLMAPLALAAGGAGGFATLSAGGWAALIVLGVVMTAGTFSVYFWIVQKAGSVRGSVVTYVMPVSALVLGAVVLGESLGPLTIGGGALTVAGVACVMYQPRLSLARQALARILRRPVAVPSDEAPAAGVVR